MLIDTGRPEQSIVDLLIREPSLQNMLCLCPKPYALVTPRSRCWLEECSVASAIVCPETENRMILTSVLGGSWDLVSKVISPLIGVISNYKYSYLIYNPSY